MILNDPMSPGKLSKGLNNIMDVEHLEDSLVPRKCPVNVTFHSRHLSKAISMLCSFTMKDV